MKCTNKKDAVKHKNCQNVKPNPEKSFGKAKKQKTKFCSKLKETFEKPYKSKIANMEQHGNKKTWNSPRDGNGNLQEFHGARRFQHDSSPKTFSAPDTSGFPRSPWRPQTWQGNKYSGWNSNRYFNNNFKQRDPTYRHNQPHYSKNRPDYQNGHRFQDQRSGYLNNYNSDQYNNSPRRYFNKQYGSGFREPEILGNTGPCENTQDTQEDWAAYAMNEDIVTVPKPPASSVLSTKTISISSDSRKPDDVADIRTDQLRLSLKASKIIDSILKGGTGKDLEMDTDSISSKTDIQPIQSGEVCSSSTSKYGNNFGAKKPSEPGSVLLDRAENLCKQIRNKREISKNEKSLTMKKVKDLQLNNELTFVNSASSSMSSFADKNMLETSTKMDYNRSKSLENSLDSITSEHMKSSLTQKPQRTNTSNSPPFDMPGKQHPFRVRTLSGSSDKTLKSSRLDRDSLSKLVNSPRSRKDQIQILKFLKTYTRQQQKHRPKLNLVTSTSLVEPEGHMLNIEDLPEDIQDQVKELIEAENAEDLDEIINLVDDSDINDNEMPDLCTKVKICKSEEDGPMTLSDLSAKNTNSTSRTQVNKHQNLDTEIRNKIRESVNAYMLSDHVQSLTSSIGDVSEVGGNTSEYGSKHRDVHHNSNNDGTWVSDAEMLSIMIPIEITPDPNYRKSPTFDTLHQEFPNNVPSDRSAISDNSLPFHNTSYEHLSSVHTEYSSVHNSSCENTIQPIDVEFSCESSVIGENQKNDAPILIESSPIKIENADQNETSTAETSNRNNFMAEIYELSLREDDLREQKIKLDVEIVNLEELINKMQEQLNDKKSLRENVVSEEKQLREKRMSLLKGAVECQRKSTSSSNASNLNIQEKIPNKSVASEATVKTVNKDNETIKNTSDRKNVTKEAEIYMKAREKQKNETEEYAKETERLARENVTYTKEKEKQYELPNQFKIPQVSLVRTNINSQSLIVSGKSNTNPVTEPDSTVPKIKSSPSSESIADSTSCMESCEPVPCTPVISLPCSSSSFITRVLPSHPPQGTTVQYMGSFNMADSDSSLLQQIADCYTSLDKIDMFLNNSSQSQNSASMETEGEDRNSGETVCLNKPKKKRNSSKKNKRKQTGGDAASSSEADSSSKGKGQPKKVRKKVNKSATAKLMKEYLHAESSTDVEINGLELPRKSLK